MKRITYITALLLLILTANTYGQFWQQTNGPSGDNIRDIAVNSNGDIFVVSRGVHRSTDKGVTWRQIFTESSLWNFRQIIIQPSGKIFVVSDEMINGNLKGVYSSIDNGNTWQQQPLGIGTLYQGAQQELFSQNSQDSGRLVRSKNDGLTWENIKTVGINGKLTWVASDTGNRLFVCADFLYRSTDDGNSWSKVINGLPAGVNRIATSNSGVLYSYIYAEQYLYKSTDGGRTWKTVSINIDRADLLDIIDIEFTLPQTITLISNERYVDDDRQICISTNNGLQWENVTTTLSGSMQLPRISVRETSNSILISSLIGMFRYDPLTKTPTPLSLPNATVTAIAAHANGSIITITQSGKAQHIEDNTPYIWNSSTEGVTWERANKSVFGMPSYNPFAIPLCFDSSQTLISASSGFIIRSSDAGSTWKKNAPDLTTGYISSIAVRFDGSILAASSNEGMFRSTDNGLTWDQLNAGITDQKLSSVAVHQNGDVYTGANNAIFKSTDMGISWQKLATNFPQNAEAVRALVVSTQGNIIAGIDSIGVYWSTDNGATWSERATGLPTKSVNALLSTPIGKVFAATTNGIYFLDTISSATWSNHSGGLTSMNVLSLCRNSEGRLFAGTEASGVFSSVQTFNIISPEAVKQTSDDASSSSLGAIYPNPSQNRITIPFTLKDRGNIQIEVVDALGKIISVIEEGHLESGAYESTFDSSALPNGTYIIRLISNGKNYYQQLVVAK